MSSCVQLERVSLNYPVYGYGGDSLKLRLLRMLFPKAVPLGTGPVNVVKALREISFRLQPGDRLGVIGPNGSGKSTLLRVVNGTYPPSEGSMVVRGRIASMLNLNCGVDGDLTGRQNIRQRLDYQGIKGSLRGRIEEEVIDFADIGSFIDLPVRMYSIEDGRIPNTTCTWPASSAAIPSVRSIRRNASRILNMLRSRAISGSSEFEIGFTRMASGTPTPRMQ